MQRCRYPRTLVTDEFFPTIGGVNRQVALVRLRCGRVREIRTIRATVEFTIELMPANYTRAADNLSEIFPPRVPRDRRIS